MFQAQKDVQDFMKMAGQELPTKPTERDEATRKLRVKLLLEEVLELAEASGVAIFVKDLEIDEDDVNLVHKFAQGKLSYETVAEPSLVDMSDALADIQYVNEGAANAFGLDLEPFFNEVHRSNMTKKWTIQDVNTYLKHSVSHGLVYNDAPVTMERDEEAYENLGSRCYIVRDAMGKLVKSPTYEQANLAAVLATLLS